MVDNYIDPNFMGIYSPNSQPSTPEVADVRLKALLENRRNLENNPSYRNEGEESNLKFLAPLLLSQGLDMLTTEQALSSPGVEERNPLTKSVPSSLGLNFLQAILALKLRGSDAGDSIRDYGTRFHSGAALGNASLNRELTGR